MTITTAFQKPGRFELQFRRDTPASVLASIGLFDHIVITANRLVPLSGFSDSAILAVSSYTGVILGRPSTYALSGQGLEFWLGADDGRGDLLDAAVSLTAGTLEQWTAALCPSSLTPGWTSAPGAGTLTYAYQWTSRREAFDHMLRAVGGERRVNNDFTIDAAPAGGLSGEPRTIVTRRQEGDDGYYSGLEATQVNAAIDADGYTTKVIVVGKTGDGAIVATGSAVGANVYKDGRNNNVTLERFVNAPSESSATVSSYATAVLDLYSSSRQTYSLSSKFYIGVSSGVFPGEFLYVYDPEAGFTDTANQVPWRGEVITPVLLKCLSATYPITNGVGVYARRSGATPTYTDLTDYVIWENEEATYEVGAATFEPAQDPSQLGSAFLGVHPEILNRVTGMPNMKGTAAARPTASADLAGFTYYATDTFTHSQCDGTGWVIMSEPLQSHTMTVTPLTGSFTTLGAKSFRYTRRDGWLTYYLSVTITTNGTAGGGVRVTTPVAPITGQHPMGHGREASVTGLSLTGFTPGGALIDIVTYASLYPGGTGYTISLTGSYQMTSRYS